MRKEIGNFKLILLIIQETMHKEQIINNMIQREKVDTNAISDGYHTFGELYEHRIALFIALCRMMQDHTLTRVWRCKTDEEWFLLCINSEPGKQISYHLPMSKWEETNFAYTHEKVSKPEWDKHTSTDVLNRLQTL